MSKFEEFIYAIEENDLNCLKQFFKKDFINKRTMYGWTALHVACTKSNGDIIRELLSLGWNIEAEVIEKMKFRPVHIAAWYGNISALKALIESRCSLDCVDITNRTPLDYALPFRRDECIRLLEEAKMTQPWIDHKEETCIANHGYTKVYKCRNLITGSYLIKKRVKLFDDNEKCITAAKALEKEVLLYTKLAANPHVVRYYGCVKTNAKIFIYLEYMEGGSLQRCLDRCGTFDFNTIASYTYQALKGLCFLHSQNVIHRDIKPDNILLDTNGNLKLCDFGISRHIDYISSVLKKDCGTVHYMAPEVLNCEDYSFPIDIWSLGITVVAMLTGHPPYHDLNRHIVSYKIGNATKVEYESPANTPRELQALIDQMLVIEPSGRATIERLLQTPFIVSADQYSD